MHASVNPDIRRVRDKTAFIGCLVAIAVAAQGCLPAPKTFKGAAFSTTVFSTTAASTTTPSATTAATTQITGARLATMDRTLTNLWKAEESSHQKRKDLNAAPTSNPENAVGTIRASASVSTTVSEQMKRIAIVEFTVEFVTVRSRTPFDSQLAVKIPPWDPIGGALEVIGIGRGQTPFKSDERIDVTTNLFNQFTTNLHELGYAVIPASEIHAQPAYDSLTKGHLDDASADSSPLDFARLLATDVGVINASTAQPAPGMRLLDQNQSQDDFRKSELLVLQNTGADATISVHLLVGCYSNRAAIEERSRVRVLRADGCEIALTSQRSLLSDKKVRKSGHFMPVVGMVEPVQADAFDREIGGLLKPYVAPALEAGLGD